MKIILIAIFYSLFSQASDSSPTKAEALALINEAFLGTDAGTLELLGKQVALVQTEMNLGFQKMSSSYGRQTTLLTCVTLSGGYVILSGRAGVCLDSSGTVYTLGGLGAGAAMGAKGSLLFGVVKHNGTIRDQYAGVSLGANPLLVLSEMLTRIQVGVGGDFIYSISQGNNTLILVGPSVGNMVKVGFEMISID
jgi:hypothetical protein